jgi:hypothetical protein
MYVCRDDVALPAVDLGFGLPTYREEMVLRAPHIGQYFQDDNVHVWNIVQNICHVQVGMLGLGLGLGLLDFCVCTKSKW